MINKTLITIIVLIVLYFLYWTISPFFRNTVVSEALPVTSNTSVSTSSINLSNTQPKLYASGTFVGFDSIHNGTGTASLYISGQNRILRFEEGFQVNNGPDLYVGFGKDGEYVKGSEIAPLKGNIGSQNYELPVDFEEKGYDSVYIWCKAFSTPFIKAVFSTTN